MTFNFNHPAWILATLGGLSAMLGTLALGFGIGEAPRPGIYMMLTGLWFGLVIGYGIWKWGSRSWTAAAITLAGTWIAWELAVNLAVQLDANWLKASAIPDDLRMYVAGTSAGALGAFVTWLGAAFLTPKLQQPRTAVAITAVGALFGLLLPWTSNYDSPAVLLLPWQTAVAAMFGLSLRFHRDLEVIADPHTALPVPARNDAFSLALDVNS